MKSRSGLTIVVSCVAVGLGVLAIVGFSVWMNHREIRNSNTFATVPNQDQSQQFGTVHQPPPPTKFGDSVEPGRNDESAFLELFDTHLGPQLSSQNRQDQRMISAIIDSPRLIDEVVRAGGKVGGRFMMQQNVPLYMIDALFADSRMRWSRTDVRRVRWSTDRREALVTAVHRQANGVPSITRRWWLVNRPDGWKVYDVEDVAIGLRVAAIIGTDQMGRVPGLVEPGGLTPPDLGPPGEDPPGGITIIAGSGLPASGAQPADVIDAFRIALLALYDTGDADPPEFQLAVLRRADVQPPLAALRELVEGTIMARKGNAVGALARFDQAENLAPGMPLTYLARAEALAKAGRFDDAHAAIRDYVQLVGPEPTALIAEGSVLDAEKKTSEAAVAYRRALDDDPDCVLAFHGLRRMLPGDAKAELGDRLGRARNPGHLFRIALPQAREERDAAAVAAMIAGLKAARPGDPQAPIEEIRDLVEAKKYAEASTAFRNAIRTIGSDGSRHALLNSFLFAMTQAGQQVEAYGAVPLADAPEAFRYLASGLEMRLGMNVEGQRVAALAALKTLIAAHRKRNANDPWLWFYDGAVMRAEKQYELAEQSFAEGQVRLEKLGGPNVTMQSNLFRSRRIDCLYDAKQAMKAYATLTPTTVTFRQLANRYMIDKDIAGLTALVAEHQKQYAGDSALLFWAGQLHFLKGEYAPAAVKYRDYQAKVGEDSAERWVARDRLIRSLIRSDDARGARAVIERETQTLSIGLYAAVHTADVLAGGGDITNLEQILREQSRAEGGLALVYHDEDFARLIANPRFAELRQKYPDPRKK